MLRQAALSPHPSPLGRVLPFVTRSRPVQVDADNVAEALMALEEHSLFPPTILPGRGIDGRMSVGAAIGPHAFRLTPAEARLLADCLWFDPTVPGFADVAARLRDAAARCELKAST